ncbi:CpaF family protein [Halomonas mongoliensis]|uniref:CpaF family protein n=1 Tax=Halomonas mongoliensis TaxID=321265 RepID=UPI00403AC3F2
MVFRSRRREVEPARSPAPTDDPAFIGKLHRALIDRLEDDQALLGEAPTQMRQRVEAMIEEYLTLSGHAAPPEKVATLAGEVLNELVGYGPLESLLADPAISDILINGPQHVFVERGGLLETAPVRFLNDGHLLRVVRRMLAPLGRRLDESSPMVDARLPDGSRVNAIIPPLALDGPCVSIRKFRQDTLTAEKLVRLDSVPEPLMTFLQRAVVERRNILISGGTGTGKTTLLNVLSATIPQGERVVTIEDSAELQLGSQHVVRLETRAANTEGEGEITARHLVKNSLRMRPDRIILGESRGDEVLDMLQAMNTGHLGSMSTVHANSARDSLVRLQMMVRLSNFQGTDALVNQIIATALDMIIQVDRDTRGHRHVGEVLQVTGVRQGAITLAPLYRRGEELPDLDAIDWSKRLQEGT